MKKYIWLLLAITLTACGSGGTSSPAPTPITKTLQDFGVPNGGEITQAAADKAAAFFAGQDGGITVYGDYTIKGDIHIPRTIALMGLSTLTAHITGPGTFAYIIPTGPPSTTSQTFAYSNITFTRVGLRYGETVNDYGVGALVTGCDFTGGGDNFGTGGIPLLIEFIHNTWNTQVSNNRMRGFQTAVKYNLAAAGPGSGSSNKITDNVIDSGSIGIFVAGPSIDGTSIMSARNNLEHLDIAIKTTNGGDGLFASDSDHLELNRIAHVDSDGPKIDINSPWAWDNNTDYPAFVFFKMHNADIVVHGGRLQYTLGKLFESTGTGQLTILP